MHSPINQIPGDAADRHPAPDQVVADALDRPEPIGWSPERAIAGGIYGFNSIDPRSRSFNLVRGRLLELKRSHNMRLIGVIENIERRLARFTGPTAWEGPNELLLTAGRRPT